MTSAQISAAARHGATFLAGLATMLGVLHYLSPEAAAQLGQGLGKIADGLGDVLVVLAPIGAAISAYFSQRSASPPKQADSLINSGEAHTIIGTPALAAETKSDRVVSSIPAPISS
jgi:hypothetical protein